MNKDADECFREFLSANKYDPETPFVLTKPTPQSQAPSKKRSRVVVEEMKPVAPPPDRKRRRVIDEDDNDEDYKD